MDNAPGEPRAAAPADRDDAVKGHGEYVCPSPRCSGNTVEAVVAREVYACPAGRHCTAATPAQRIANDQEIAKRVAARRRATKESL